MHFEYTAFIFDQVKLHFIYWTTSWMLLVHLENRIQGCKTKKLTFVIPSCYNNIEHIYSCYLCKCVIYYYPCLSTGLSIQCKQRLNVKYS